MSEDIEDIITIIDGRPEIEAEVQTADSELRLYLQQVFRSFLSNRDFIDALPGHLPPDAASQARIPVLLGRIRSICDFKLIRKFQD